MGDYRKYFINIIKNKYPNEFDKIVADTDTEYKNISPDTAFAKTSRNPVDRRLDFCSYFLALIKRSATLDLK